MSNDERVFLEADDAIAMLDIHDGHVHTFTPGPMMIGCDWKKGAAIDFIREGKPELSGEIATGMGHGLCVISGNTIRFFATIKEASK